MPSFPAYPQQLWAKTIPEWWGPRWTALKWPHFSNQQHAAPKTSCNNWEKSVMGTSTCLCTQETHRDCSVFLFSPSPYFGLDLAFSFSQLLLAVRPVNDGPHSTSEPWVDACLCDSCGVLSKTKAAWQAAALRLDQTGLVYWSAPLCSALLRSRFVTAVRRVGEIRSSLLENGNHSDHTQGLFCPHKGKLKRLIDFGYDFFNHFMSVMI